jgi:hypothetical protein
MRLKPHARNLPLAMAATPTNSVSGASFPNAVRAAGRQRSEARCRSGEAMERSPAREQGTSALEVRSSAGAGLADLWPSSRELSVGKVSRTRATDAPRISGSYARRPDCGERAARSQWSKGTNHQRARERILDCHLPSLSITSHCQALVTPAAKGQRQNFYSGQFMFLHGERRYPLRDSQARGRSRRR